MLNFNRMIMQGLVGLWLILPVQDQHGSRDGSQESPSITLQSDQGEALRACVRVRTAEVHGVPGAHEGTSGLFFNCIEETHGDLAVQRQVSQAILLLHGKPDLEVFIEAPKEIEYLESSWSAEDHEALLSLGDAFLESGDIDGVTHAWLQVPFPVRGMDSARSREWRSQFLRDQLEPAWRELAVRGFAESRGSLALDLESLRCELDGKFELLPSKTRELLQAAGGIPGREEADLSKILALLAGSEPSIEQSSLELLADRIRNDLEIEKRLTASRNTLVERLYRSLAPHDAGMVDVAVRHLVDCRASEGILVFGTFHTPGVLRALREGNHSYRLLTPLALREGDTFEGSWIDRGDTSGFAQVVRGSLRPAPRLVKGMPFVREFLACFVMEWMSRRRQLPLGQGVGALRSPFQREESFAVENIRSLPGRLGLPVHNAFLSSLASPLGSILGYVAPRRRRARSSGLRGLPVGDHVIGFLRTHDLATFQSTHLAAEAATDPKYFERFLDMVAARDIVSEQGGVAALSLFKNANGDLVGLSMDVEGHISRLPDRTARKLTNLMVDQVETGVADGGVSALIEETVKPLFLGIDTARRTLLLRCSESDFRWPAIASNKVLGTEITTLLAQDGIRADGMSSLRVLARKFVEAPRFRRGEDGKIQNLVLVVNSPRRGDTQRWEPIIDGLRQEIESRHVLFNADRTRVVSAFAHASSMRNAVVILVAHTVEQGGQGGLVLNSGERLDARDLEALRGVHTVHTSIGSCRFGSLEKGRVVRSIGEYSGGVIGVSPEFLRADSVESSLRSLLKLIRSRVLESVHPLHVPRRIQGESKARSGSLFLGIRIPRTWKLRRKTVCCHMPPHWALHSRDAILRRERSCA